MIGTKFFALCDEEYLEAKHSLRSLLSSLPCRTLQDKQTHYIKNITVYIINNEKLSADTDAYNWARWAGGASLSIFSIWSLEDSKEQHLSACLCLR